MELDWKSIVQIVEIVAFIVGGFVISYLRTSDVVHKFVAALIADAEELFATVEKSGAQKMAWVIEQIYAYVPAWLKPFLTAEKIQAIVQAVFDKIKAYADIQVSKWQAQYDAWKNAKLLELEAEKKNAAALRMALEKAEAENDEKLSAALAAKIDAEAELSRMKSAAAKATTKVKKAQS